MPLPAIIQSALRIRALENKLLELFEEGSIHGTVHTCIGQETCATALAPHLDLEKDAFFGTHRCHGHLLALGGPEDAFLAELMGREGALCLGRGGSQHLAYKNFYSNGVQGSVAPLAVGFAWALKMRGEGGIAVAQLGDGTLGEGAVYEALTFASILRVPALFFLEYNGIAQTTDVSKTTPGDLIKRINGFGVDALRFSDNDPEDLSQKLSQAVAQVRDGRPLVTLVDTQRLGPHSKGDDLRPPEEIRKLRERDPLNSYLEKDQDVKNAIDRVAYEVSSRPFLKKDKAHALPPLSELVPGESLHCKESEKRMVQLLNQALHELLSEDPNVVVLGEDIADPYGGAFKVTKNLTTSFPERTFSTPIAEGAIVGVSNGLALAGMRPICELMFADFATLACDQLVNHAAKFHYSYGGKATCPITLRLVSGAGRGYGPTHSQSLELLFCGVPGLRVLSLSSRHQPDLLLKEAVYNDAPTVFVEHKSLYGMRPQTQPPLDLRVLEKKREKGTFPPLQYVPVDGGEADITVATYGGMAPLAEEAMRRMILENELRFDYFIFTELWPLHVEEIMKSVERSKKLIVIEENVSSFGFGAALISEISQRISGSFRSHAVGAYPVPIPCGREQEKEVLPSLSSVLSAMKEMS